jgi:hypothetical protein
MARGPVPQGRRLQEVQTYTTMPRPLPSMADRLRRLGVTWWRWSPPPITENRSSKLRCCPRRTTTIVQAILVLHAIETGRYSG